MTVFVILTVIAFIGGTFAVVKVGSKDGICNYGQVGEDDGMDR